MKKASNKSFLVIGLGRFGMSILKTLVKMDCEVLAVDINEEQATEAANYTDHCLICDASKPEVLQDIGAGEIDHAVIAIGSHLQTSIQVLINLQKLGVRQITIRADDAVHAEIYQRLGATEIIIPEEVFGKALAYQIMSDSVLDYYHVYEDFSIVKISVGKDFSPATIKALNVRKAFGINIVGIIREDRFLLPNADDLLQPGDVVAVVGTTENYQRFDRFLNISEKKIEKSVQ